MNILEKITKLRLERDWTEYQLSERSGLTQSTISSWYRKNLIPSIPSLSRICDAFGISLAQFFSDSSDPLNAMTSEQADTLRRWNRLTPQQQEMLAAFLDSVLQ